jgi:hypothetical protein
MSEQDLVFIYIVFSKAQKGVLATLGWLTTKNL